MPCSPGSRAESLSIGVTNGRQAHILSGRPAELEAVVSALEAAARRSANDRKERRRGGAVLNPVTEFLVTSVPFHTPLLAPAVEDVVAWAERAGLNTTLARELAVAVLIDPVDWPALVDHGARLDRIPSRRRSRARHRAHASDRGHRGRYRYNRHPGRYGPQHRDLDRPGATPVAAVDRARFAPRLTRLPDGRLTLDTAFTRLTGRSAVLLSGMTPTTVDPEIVAAALTPATGPSSPVVARPPPRS